MENLSSDEEDEKQPFKSARLKISSISCSLRKLVGSLTLNLGQLRDRLAHTIANPASRWLAIAMIGCLMESLNFNLFTAYVYNISEMCYALRKEQQCECTSQFQCMKMAIWHAPPLFYLSFLGFIFAPIFLREAAERLRNYGFTHLKIMSSYLTVVNLHWLLEDAWSYWTNVPGSHNL